MTLPAKFRDQAGLSPGDVLFWQKVAPGRFEVQVLSHRSLRDFERVDVKFDMSALREEMGKEIAREFTKEAVVPALAEVAATSDA